MFRPGAWILETCNYGIEIASNFLQYVTRTVRVTVRPRQRPLSAAGPVAVPAGPGAGAAGAVRLGLAAARPPAAAATAAARPAAALSAD